MWLKQFVMNWLIYNKLLPSACLERSNHWSIQLQQWAIAVCQTPQSSITPTWSISCRFTPHFPVHYLYLLIDFNGYKDFILPSYGIIVFSFGLPVMIIWRFYFFNQDYNGIKFCNHVICWIFDICGKSLKWKEKH